MKRLYSILVFILIINGIIGQVPASFKYQAVLRDISGNVKANADVSIDIAILQGSASGSQVFIETHNVTTNEFGLVNLEIGFKNPKGFSDIDWSVGPYFIKISVDNIEMGTSQLLSVPYALYAKTAENGFSGNYNDLSNTPDFTGWDNNTSDDFNGSYDELTNIPSNIDEDRTDDVTLTGNQIIGGNITFSNTILANDGLNSNNTKITNVANPETAGDVVNKAYLDEILLGLGLIPNNFDGFITDIEGNTYKTVKIGDEIWMAENLKTTKYNDGSTIPVIEEDSDWNNYGASSIGAMCYYNNDISNKAIYGALYNWPTVASHKLCPVGWHVPRHFGQIVGYLGGWGIAGGKMKEAGYNHWQSPNTGATNESGFTGLPGGYRNYVGFSEIGIGGYWLLDGYLDHPSNPWINKLNYLNTSVSDLADGSNGFSIRCVKD